MTPIRITPSDTQILDWLQKQNNLSRYTGRAIFRLSSYKRGWRLHETNQKGGVKSVREAIILAMQEERGL